MSEKRLAIVIPAYKIEFLEETLKSIAGQTCKDFTLYIGDDASKYDLKSIAEKYLNKIDIEYTRFETNLGGTDLIAHWNRCIHLTRKEEWIWLFSDDDVMAADCVESFFRYVNQYPTFDIFHFNLIRINEKGVPLGDTVNFPEIITKEDLLVGRLESSLQTTVVEYIFKRERLFNEGMFQNFDLAWGSDDATWIKIARYTAIKNISCSTVFWRKSSVNISTQDQKEFIFRKMNARIHFTRWILHEFGYENINLKPKLLRKKFSGWFDRFLVAGSNVLGWEDIKILTFTFYSLLGCSPGYSRYKTAIFLYIKQSSRIKEVIKGILVNK